MAKSLHDQIAENLAKKHKVPYKSDKGVDIVTRDRVIEVETKKESLDQGMGQVARSSKARYLAVPKSLENKALEKTKDTGIGVMSKTGRIVKKAGRRG